MLMLSQVIPPWDYWLEVVLGLMLALVVGMEMMTWVLIAGGMTLTLLLLLLRMMMMDHYLFSSRSHHDTSYVGRLIRLTLTYNPTVVIYHSIY